MNIDQVMSDPGLCQVENLIPPNSTDVEQGILSGILQQPDLITHAVGVLQPEHFYRSAHVEIFRAMLTCFEQGAPIEPLALTDALKIADTLDIAGGGSYVWDLLIKGAEVQVIDPTSFRYWAKQLIDLARRRELITACHDIQESAHDRANKAYQEEAENLLFLLSDAYPDVDEAQENPLDAALASLEQEITSPNGVTGLSTGFPILDKSTHGFQPFQLITVSARPGGGKSAFALNVASHVVMNERKPVLYISLEMMASELVKRVLKAMAGTDMNLSLVKQSGKDLQPYMKDFILRDAAGQTLAAIQSQILKAKKARPDLGLIVVDHIGLIASDPKAKQQNRAYEIQQITSRLKSLAKTIQVPILQLAQMNRAIEARQEKTKPQLSDLRDSGSIEMDSDLVLFTHIERDENRKPTGNACLTIAKQRDGVQVEIPLVFIPHLTRFKEPAVTFP